LTVYKLPGLFLKGGGLEENKEQKNKHGNNVLTLTVEEGFRDPIVKINGKVGIITRKSRLKERIEPGDLIECEITADMGNYYIVRPLKILKKAPENIGVLTLEKTVEEDEKGFFIRLGKSPVFERVRGKIVKILVFLEGE